MVFFASNAGLFSVLTLTLRDGFGCSPLTAGSVFAPLAVTFAVASLIGPWLSARWGHYVLTLGYGVNAVGGAVPLGMSLGVTVLRLVFSTSLGDGPSVTASHLNAFTTALVGNLALAVAVLGLLRFLARTRIQPNG